MTDAADTFRLGLDEADRPAPVPTYDPATRQIVKDSSVPASAYPPVDLLATAEALSRVIAQRAADLPEGGLTSLHNAYVVLRELARVEAGR